MSECTSPDLVRASAAFSTKALTERTEHYNDSNEAPAAAERLPERE
jgi:hypothetical protein